MTMRKKLLILIACLSLILCTLVGGTIAWLTAQTNPVTNTFTPSDITVTLTESENLDLKMVPGKPITKDPTVTVAKGSEACYLFVKIEESGNFDAYMEYTVADGWIELTGVAGVYYREVSSSDADQVFPVLKDDQVTVRDSVNKEMMEALKAAGAQQPTLSFTAYAIQKEYLSNNGTAVNSAEDAWELITP